MLITTGIGFDNYEIVEFHQYRQYFIYCVIMQNTV